MRYVVLIFAILGVLGSGLFGYKWMDNYQYEKEKVWVTPEARDEYLRRAKAWPFLLAGAALGLFGACLAFVRRRYSGAALLLCAALGPAVFHPGGAIFSKTDQSFELGSLAVSPGVLFFNFGLLFAGLLAFLIRPPRPRRLAPAAASDDSSVDDGE